ncbi:unnamed protein product [Paramecium primaurelia]|uniref:Uncharacterized protein n=1 Tax=Paramecium primaurelia TaxID=5886 RepID=A0A8S1NHZ3_PARPR|nr:unnamed protein product [Paramecium primaurelia]
MLVHKMQKMQWQSHDVAQAHIKGPPKILYSPQFLQRLKYEKYVSDPFKKFVPFQEISDRVLHLESHKLNIMSLYIYIKLIQGVSSSKSKHQEPFNFQYRSEHQLMHYPGQQILHLNDTSHNQQPYGQNPGVKETDYNPHPAVLSLIQNMQIFTNNFLLLKKEMDIQEGQRMQLIHIAYLNHQLNRFQYYVFQFLIHFQKLKQNKYCQLKTIFHNQGEYHQKSKLQFQTQLNKLNQSKLIMI